MSSHGIRGNCCSPSLPSKLQSTALLKTSLAVTLFVFLAFVPFAQTPSGEPELFLTKHLGFTASELNQLEKGQIIVRVPKTHETREVAVSAVARVDVPAQFFEASVRDIVEFKKSDNVLQIGKFSSPPRLDDLKHLAMEPGDIDAIRRCRINNCGLKLPASFIERFRTEIDWSAPDYRDRVSTMFRQILLSQVLEYLRVGDAALGQYDDKPYPLRRADELRLLLEPAPYVYDPVPSFQNYLKEFPNSSLAVEDIVYWSKEKFGAKAVISVTHLMIYRHDRPGGNYLRIASKGIYASHYIEATLGLTTFVQQTTPGGSRSYLIYLNRSRADALRGLLAALKRSLIIGSVRDGAKKNMQLLKERLERQYRAANN